MSSPATFSTAPAINPPIATVNHRLISPASSPHPPNHSPTLRNLNTNKPNPIHRIRSSASESTATISAANPAPSPASASEEETPAKIGARVRVKVPLTVYHIPKVPEVDMYGKEGRIKENVAVWRGKNISANFPYKIEFFEKLEGRGDAPVKFFVHLKEDEFEYIH